MKLSQDRSKNRDLVLPALNLRFLIPEISVIVFKSCYIFFEVAYCGLYSQGQSLFPASPSLVSGQYGDNFFLGLKRLMLYPDHSPTSDMKW